jgi:cation:H+ antiporter
LLVDSAQSISTALDVDQGFIGLTVVAIGTSLPELAASVAAARKGQSGLIAGNIFGSNLFNMLFVGGATALTSPIQWDGSLKIEMLLMLVVTLLLALVFRKRPEGVREMGRVPGTCFVVLYIGILIYSASTLT